MLIKETKLRTIIREEARRVLREEGVPAAPAAAPAAPAAAQDPAAAAAAALQASVEAALQYVIMKDKLQPIRMYLQELVTKGAASKAAPRVAEVLLRPDLPDDLRAQYVVLAIGNLPTTNTTAVTNTQTGDLTEPLAWLGWGGAAGLIGSNRRAQAAFLKALGDLPTFLRNAKITSEWRPAAAQAAQKTVTVKTGDTISAILAANYGVPVNRASAALYTEFAKLNGIANPNLIKVGAVLKLPPTLGQYQLKA